MFIAAGFVTKVAVVDVAEEMTAEGKALADTVVVCEIQAIAPEAASVIATVLSLARHMAAVEGEIGSLVLHRIFSEHADNAAHGVASVKRGLRTAQHINAVYIGKVEVVARGRYLRHAVDIEGHSWRTYS